MIVGFMLELKGVFVNQSIFSRFRIYDATYSSSDYIWKYLLNVSDYLLVLVSTWYKAF